MQVRLIVKQIVSQLGLSGAMRLRVFDASEEKQDLNVSDMKTMMETKLIEVHRCKEHSNGVVTPVLCTDV